MFGALALAFQIPMNGQQFRAAHVYQVGSNPVQAAVGDFNNDGYQDLAVSNNPASGNGSVSVLLANAKGAFGTAVNYPITGRPDGIAVGDFNHDGSLDLAVATSHGVQVLLGKGDGTFQSAVEYAPNAYQLYVVAGDFNGDGNLDLVTTGSGEIYFWAGNGDGTFKPGVLLLTGGNTYGAVVAADFNGDGKLDFASALSGSTDVAVFLGNGNGTFQPPVNYQVGGDYPAALTVGDFNGDGKLDLATVSCGSKTSCSGSGDLSELLGNGDGTFQKAKVFAQATDLSPVSIATADFNGDGKADLVVSNGVSDDVSEFLGNGDGTFKHAENWAAGSGPYFVVVGDFNGDGVPDVATVNSAGNVSVLLGSKSNGFAAARDFANKAQAGFVATGDFNGDGILDLAVTTGTAGSVNVMLGQKGGTFAAPVSYALATGGSVLSQVVAVALNGDHHLDLVVTANSVAAPVSVLLGNGDGTFKAAVAYTAGPFPLAVTVGDFNGDGIPDLAVDNFGWNVYGSVSLLIGNGDGTFKAATTVSVGNNYPEWITSGDFNGDGKLDLAVVNPGYGDAGTVGVLLGHGDGTFGPLMNGPLVGVNPSFILAADLNGDGKLDLVVTDYLVTTDNLKVLLGHGDGTFGTPVSYTAGQQPQGVAVADFNGDGIPDLAVANTGSTGGTGSALLLLGTGGGAFKAGPSVLAGSGPYSLAAGDFNGDGKMDLAVANVEGDNITTLLNMGP
jgi:hypothetical protein